ncbi:LON peptidase substrate-binding domain-containing protein [bacterium]|nr:LON peptidase substrate-binding domain-containing protein [Rubripirellula sp.]MDB4561360.1 LON peptidase substrate-binding domain-containing protein [bacterium]MDB4621414.1 LON peptidase substrate-binding domain-containing protein [Rubripirellula sp.]
MDDLDAVTRLPDDFDGRVRLFPLPEMVLFPHAMQPLHIFEPRYCEMLSEALAGDHLIAMSTLTGGDLGGVLTDPPIASTVCLGRIISHAEVEEGRHNVLLVGVRRAQVVTELDAGRPFRMATVDVLDDIYPPTGATERGQLKNDLLEAFGEVIPASVNAQQNLHDLMAGQMGLGPITDIISYTLPFEVVEKLRLLSDSNVDSRAAELVRLLRSGSINLQSVSTADFSDNARGKQEFPPPFSLN